MVGGLEQTPLKYEKGARFKTSSGEQVETKAMGRGKMEPIINLWFSEKVCELGSMIISARNKDNLYRQQIGYELSSAMV